MVHREWAEMGDDFDASWRRVGPRLVTVVTAAQLGAATDGAAYVPEALAASGHRIEPIAPVNVRAFAGAATSVDPLAYGSLEALLYGAVTHARTAAASSLAERLAVGRTFLDTAIHTQIADAARMSAGVAINARPHVGWVRMVNPPCCQRCALLAGKFFKSNRGFARHPRCDCRHIPQLESDPMARGIRIGPDDVKDLTIAQRRAISDGADMNQVINANRKGQRTADGLYTLEGTTRRGWASQVKREVARQKGELAKETTTSVGQRGSVKNYTVRRVGPRPTPEGIYRFASTREEAIDLLRANGYFVGPT